MLSADMPIQKLDLRRGWVILCMVREGQSNLQCVSSLHVRAWKESSTPPLISEQYTVAEWVEFGSCALMGNWSIQINCWESLRGLQGVHIGGALVCITWSSLRI